MALGQECSSNIIEAAKLTLNEPERTDLPIIDVLQQLLCLHFLILRRSQWKRCISSIIRWETNFRKITMPSLTLTDTNKVDLVKV
jgi:hypothetical protein